MKKLISLLLVSIAAMSLGGCTDENGESSSKSSNTSSVSSASSAASETITSSDPSSSGASSDDIVSGIESDVGSTTSTIESNINEMISDGSVGTMAQADGQVFNWGAGRSNNHTRPADPVKYQHKYGDKNAFFIAPDEKSVYITFDEGYENGYTEVILDTLAEKGVSAVFFVTFDYAKDNPEIIRRIIDEGHIVGNHTMKHPDMSGLSKEKATDQIMKLHNYIKEEFGYEMTLFRFPMGCASDESLSLVQSLGYKSVFWSFAYKDWITESQPDGDTAFRTITDNLHNGSIILLHAVSSTNASILPDVISEIRNQGYEIKKWDL